MRLQSNKIIPNCILTTNSSLENAIPIQIQFQAALDQKEENHHFITITNSDSSAAVKEINKSKSYNSFKRCLNLLN